MKTLKEFEGFTELHNLNTIKGGMALAATCISSGCTETGLAHDDCSDECSD